MSEPKLDYLELGSSPANETCAQVGAPDYPERSRRECRIWAEQLQRVLDGEIARRELDLADVLLYVGVHTEWGHNEPRREAAVKFDPANETAVALAFWLEKHTPAEWDLPALALLATLRPEATT